MANETKKASVEVSASLPVAAIGAALLCVLQESQRNLYNSTIRELKKDTPPRDYWANKVIGQVPMVFSWEQATAQAAQAPMVALRPSLKETQAALDNTIHYTSEGLRAWARKEGLTAEVLVRAGSFLSAIAGKWDDRLIPCVVVDTTPVPMPEGKRPTAAVSTISSAVSPTLAALEDVGF